MLDIKQLKKLRSEIVLNSLYTNDYENTLNICPIDVQMFFDSYIDYLMELQEDDEDYGVETDISYYDTDNNLEDWLNCYEDDPLPYSKTYHYMRENRIPFSTQKYKELKEIEDTLEI